MKEITNVTTILELVEKIRASYTLLSKPLLDEFKISKTDFDIIMFLSNNKEYTNAKDIVRIKKLKPNVVSIHIDGLVKDGYIKRENILNDKRKIKLVCTDKTNEIVRKGRIMQKEFYNSLNKNFTINDKENFKRYINILLDNANNLELELINKGE